MGLNVISVRSIWALAVILMQVSLTSFGISSIGQNVTVNYDFNPGQNIDESFQWSNELNLFDILAAEVDVDAGFYLGFSLPFRMSITYPEWLTRSCSFTSDFSANGKSGGQLGLDVSGDIEVTVSAIGGLVSWTPIDKSLSIDLSANFVTPIGEDASDTISNRVEIASFTVPIIDFTIKAYVGVVVDFRIRGELSSDLTVSGTSLVSQHSEVLLWNRKNQVHSCSLQTTSQASSSIRLNLDNTELVLSQCTVTVDSFFIEFEATDRDSERLSLSVPDFVSATSSSEFQFTGFTIDEIVIPMHVDSDSVGLGLDISPSEVIPIFTIVGLVGAFAVGFLLFLNKRNR